MFVCAVKSEFICCRLKERQRHRDTESLVPTQLRSMRAEAS